jgi:hypothetical protein
MSVSLSQNLATWIAIVTGVAAIIGGYTDFMSHFNQIDTKLNELEKQVEKMDGKLDINANRWAAHFDLWGESIRNRGDERGVDVHVFEEQQ